MPAAERTIDYRLRTGRQCYEVPSQARNGVVETGIQHLLQNNKQPSSATRSARRQSRSAVPVPGVADPSSMEEERTARSLTILVADDHPMVREGLVAVINRQSDMRVVAEAVNGREAVEKFVTLRPDIALLDLRMPLMDGIEAAMSISEHSPEARLIIVTTYQSEEDIYRALRAGAQGYLLKDAPVEDLIECIHTVGDGKTWIPPAVGAKLARRVTERSLTARETEVIRALAKGKSNKEIGVALNISEGTVKVHVTHMLEKLKVTGRTEAIGAALKRGLVTME